MNWKHWIVMVVAGSVVAAALAPGAQATNIRDVIEDYQACTIAAMVLIFVDLMPVEGGIAWGLCQVQLGAGLIAVLRNCPEGREAQWSDLGLDPNLPNWSITLPLQVDDRGQPMNPEAWRYQAATVGAENCT